jgi:hypothetical protein
VIEEVLTANEETVRAGLEHLQRAYEEFINTYPGPVDYVDGFMIAHNFHVLVILDLEAKLKADPEGQLFLRKLAKDTFAKALEEKP